MKTYRKLLKIAFSRVPKLNKGLLKILHIENLQFCIVSNNSKKFILKTLNNYKISKYFKKKNIIALRGGIHPKPSPHGYLQILKKIKCKTSEIIVLEDSLTGVTAAKKAKIKYIFRYNPFKLKKIKSTVNISSFLPLKDFINSKY
jgi:HAD superfamily hydrolase (TIGR01509 family)